MTINELRVLYRSERLVEAIVEQSSQDGLWLVEFRDSHGGILALTDPQGEQHYYSDLDSASKSAMAVGFSQVRVEIL
ncbi:thymidylate kinase [Vibrio sp. UCD-FRSSP16_10]|uniref:thymidylate kinase n=1 Tax=unclassified Vibrio TaxID=2614977 RepID=UPI0007FB9909|nr:MULTISPECIES: thymidylate kinase [unclassified Vibrio]OBT16368.1 thymidylate kinase [Vibrio sp. UCD-FRSSP16_30]OBT21232.1 thymidylate kinase [Vibrio sp. UCD-FRSSP16_10]